MKSSKFLLLFLIILLVIPLFQIFNVYATQHNFGYETKGSSQTKNDGYAYKCLFYLSESGIANTITIYVKNVDYAYAHDLDVGIYSGLTLLSHLTLSISALFDNWKVFDIADVNLTVGTYGLGFKQMSGGTSQLICYYNAGTTNQSQYDSKGVYDPLPNPFVVDGQSDRKYSIYCTYTVSEGKIWNDVEIWKLNLYTFNWFVSEFWKINIHNYAWFNPEIWKINLHNLSWFNIETWLLNLHNFSWFNIEIWKLNLYGFSWFSIETWMLNLHNYSWFNIETWLSNLHTIGWYNVEAWLLYLRNPIWVSTEIWKLFLNSGHWYATEIWKILNSISSAIGINFAFLLAGLALCIALVAVVFSLSKKEKE
jgi:hypothetical protein